MRKKREIKKEAGAYLPLRQNQKERGRVGKRLLWSIGEGLCLYSAVGGQVIFNAGDGWEGEWISKE